MFAVICYDKYTQNSEYTVKFFDSIEEAKDYAEREMFGYDDVVISEEIGRMIRQIRMADE